MSLTASPPRWTIGSIATECGVPVHRVRDIIEARGIEPVFRAARFRLFSDADVERIRSELRRIETDREGVPHD